MTEEFWKFIKGTSLPYEVSSYGKIRRKLKNGKFSYLKFSLDKKQGYFYVRLKVGRYFKKRYVHRLIAESFIPNQENKPNIDHINTIRTDNRIENLRWVTQKENSNNPISVKHMSVSKTGNNNHNYGKPRSEDVRRKISEGHKRGGKLKGRTGALNPHSIPVYMYDLNGVFLSSFTCAKEASIMTGIYQSGITNCCNGKCFSAGKHIWRKYKADLLHIKHDIQKNEQYLQ